MTLYEIERGLAILNRVALHYAQRGKEAVPREARLEVVFAVKRLCEEPITPPAPVRLPVSVSYGKV